MTHNDSQKRPRVFAFGDIHGCIEALEALLAVIRPCSQDVCVFLGDYVDVGPSSKSVIDALIALRQQASVVTLLGNHERKLLLARHSQEEFTDWLRWGGNSTLKSYNAGVLADIPQDHWEFLSNLLPYFEIPSHIFVHAGVDPSLPLPYQPAYELYHGRILSQPARHISGKTVVAGHTIQQARPKDWGSTLLIDTGCGRGGWLTCLDVASRRYWQASEHGVVRSGWLEPYIELGEDSERRYPHD